MPLPCLTRHCRHGPPHYTRVHLLQLAAQAKLPLPLPVWKQEISCGAVLAVQAVTVVAELAQVELLVRHRALGGLIDARHHHPIEGILEVVLQRQQEEVIMRERERERETQRETERERDTERERQRDRERERERERGHREREREIAPP